MTTPRKRTIVPVEALFGAIGKVAEAAAAGAIREGARRARGFVQGVDGKLGRVERLAEGELEPCKQCGKIAREHKEGEDHTFVSGEPSKPRRRKRKPAHEG